MWIFSQARRWSLARQMLALQIVVVGVTAAGGTLMAFFQARSLLTEEATAVTRAVAVSVAQSPAVLDALDDARPTDKLQPYAESVRTKSDVDFITIMSTTGIRYTHPNPSQIGGRFLGNTAPALQGTTFSESYTGTLGRSIRTVTPVMDGTGTVRALVSSGITIDKISDRFFQQVAIAAPISVIGLSVAMAGTYLVGARLRRQTHGLGPMELSRIYEYHQAILHAVREGLLLIDVSGRLTLCNDAARDLLQLAADAEGRHVTELGLPPSLTELLAAGKNGTDEIHLTGERVLVVNVAVVRSGTRSHGTVVTLRDHTELRALTGQLDATRGFAESLRSAAHESANRLHTVITLVELGRPQQAVAFGTAELRAAQELTDRVVGAVREPVLAALLLGKSAEASERGVELSISQESELDDIGLDERELVTILGNLIDNAMDAAVSGTPPARVEVHIGADDDTCLIRVADSGPGLDAARADEVFQRGWTTKGSGRGLGLAIVAQAVRRLGGEIEVGYDRGAVFTVRLPVRAESPA